MQLLEAGLCALLLVAPLPFGSVGRYGRLSLELLAFVLTAVWCVLALRREVAVPPRRVAFALIGLLGIAAIQLVPIGEATVSAISPRTATLVAGLDPRPSPTLSLAPGATASALRTGAALTGILFVATSVVAARGAKRLALAALCSAAFQGLYGLLVLASGHDKIWNVPKTTYLDSATGTFVNRNHFAGFLAATIPLGVGLVIGLVQRALRRTPRQSEARHAVLIRAFGPDGTRAMLAGLLVLVATAGLMLSLSRAGTALGVAAIAGTSAFALRSRPAFRIAAIALIVLIAAVPLLDLGADRLVARYAESGEEIHGTGGRLDVARDTLRMIAAFPVAGVGFGAFTWAYPTFSSPRVRMHYTHAHDDLLQLGAEGGLPALALLAIALSALLPALRRAAAGEDPVLAGAAFGLGALLVHGLVDFNFHIPANAAVAAVLLGALLGGSWTARS